MIIWIDGPNGVGKSSVAHELAKILDDGEYIDSDRYWLTFLKNSLDKAFRGFYPYCNKYFLTEFRNKLEEKVAFNKVPIVTLSLVNTACKEVLLDYFCTKTPMVHIILECDEEKIRSRIENDPNRDKSAKIQQKYEVGWQISYLKTNYKDAVRIKTENKDCKEIAGIIKNKVLQ